MTTAGIRACAAGLMTLTALPALGQAWIGQIAGQMVAEGQEHQCMMGMLATEKETAEARRPASEAMRTYWAAAHAQDRANVLPAFHEGAKARWTRAGVELKGPGLASVTDPTARAAAALSAEPRKFVRAGDSGTAHGLWETTDANGRPAGVYLAGFRRVLGVWKLQSIEVGPAAVDEGLFAPYCHKPGDTAVYRAAMAERDAKRAAKKARKQAERTAG